MKVSLKFETISEYHRFSQLDPPEHPMVSLIDYSLVKYPAEYNHIKWEQNFYSIGLKRNVAKKFNYGHQPYDFEEGVLAMVAPHQVLNIEIDPKAKANPSGWLLLIHPDFLWNTSLARKIKKYNFFGYAVNEALFLSQKEEIMMLDVFQNIQREYRSNIDRFTQNIIISQIELLLHYTERFYERQFFTRKISNHNLISQFEKSLDEYFESESLIEKGAPNVLQLSEALHLTPNYLSTLLKLHTGRSTQQHIQLRMIDKAKELLSTTSMNVGEIAYTLGFEHPTSFNKLFKNKTQISPLVFRSKFN